MSGRKPESETYVPIHPTAYDERFNVPSDVVARNRELYAAQQRELDRIAKTLEPGVKAAVPNQVQWRVISHFLQTSPQEQPMLDEYRKFLHEWLPDILLTGDRPIMKQAHSQQHTIHFTDVAYFPPAFRTSNGTLLLNSADKSYERCATYALSVCVDVKHTKEYFRPAVTLADLFQRVQRGELLLPHQHIAIKCVLEHVLCGGFDEGGKEGGGGGGGGKKQEMPCAVRYDLVQGAHRHRVVGRPGTAASAALAALDGQDVVVIIRFPQDQWSADLGGPQWLGMAGVDALSADDPWVVEFAAAQTQWQPFPEYHRLVRTHKSTTWLRKHPLFSCPLMVGAVAPHPYYSSLHELLSANVGSLIINGLSKVLHSQVRLLVNACFVFPGKKKVLLTSECRSLRESTKWNSTSTFVVSLLRKTSQFVCNIPFFSKGKTSIDVPLQTVFLLLGVRSQEEMEKYLLPGHCPVPVPVRKFLRRVATFDWSRADETAAAAVREFAGKMNKSEAAVRSTFHYQLLPHAEKTRPDGSADHTGKLLFLGTMVRKIASVAKGVSRVDCRDNAKNKQVQNAGSLLAGLLRTIIKSVKQDTLRELGKLMKPNKDHNFSVQRALCSRRRFDSKLSYHFNSGHFSLYSQTAGKGYLQMRIDANDVACRNQVSTIALPLNRDSKSKEPRDLHGSCYGYDGTSHTPEGDQTGLINSATYMSRLTKGVPSGPVETILKSMKKGTPGSAERLAWIRTDVHFTATAASGSGGGGAGPGDGAEHHVDAGTPVYVNGKLLGLLTGPQKLFVAAVRDLKHWMVLSAEVAVFFDPGMAAVMVQTDGGRRLKPVYVAASVDHLADAVAGMAPGDNWFAELQTRGIITFISPAEEQGLVVATSLEDLARKRSAGAADYYTHAALHATSLFAPSVATMPFANMDQAARQIYRSCQQKQTISQSRDPDAKRRLAPNINMSLCYAFRALSQTMLETITTTPQSEQKSVPAMMWVLALDNPEDSVVMAQNFVDFGGGMRSVVFVETTKTCLTAENMFYGKPGPTCSHRKLHVSGRDVYHALDDDGFPRIGARVQAGDVIVGRVNKIYKRTATGTDVLTLHCASKETKRTGRILSVSRAEQGEFDVVIVRIYQLVKPQVGDKLASRHAQKGTIGAIWPQADLPWSPTAGTPDIIINPHAFPSRMTIGHLREMLAGKQALIEGRKWVDATPFNSDARVSLEYVMAVLRLNGACDRGDDVAYSGTSGRRLRCRVMTGCVDYEFLRHIAHMKTFVRGLKGNNVKSTRQPVRGGGVGGLAMGEMERNANLEHGSAYIYRALVVDNSDPAWGYTCAGCDHAVDAPPHHARMQFAQHKPCRMCGGTRFVRFKTSHGFNLLRAELQGCNIKLECRTIRERD
jgi:DNA-directed RNA polymerase II subunit RPB2